MQPSIDCTAMQSFPLTPPKGPIKKMKIIKMHLYKFQSKYGKESKKKKKKHLLKYWKKLLLHPLSQRSLPTFVPTREILSVRQSEQTRQAPLSAPHTKQDSLTVNNLLTNSLKQLSQSQPSLPVVMECACRWNLCW